MRARSGADAAPDSVTGRQLGGTRLTADQPAHPGHMIWEHATAIEQER